MTAAGGEAAPSTTITKTANPERAAAAGWAAVRPFLWQFKRILVMASSLAYVLWCFVPHSIPTYDPRFILDNSWIQALHVAFERHWQFGRDIVFTYGPWGFLCGGYYPPTFLTSVIAWSALSIIFWLGSWRVASHCFRNQWSAWLWIMALVGVIALPTGQNVIIDVRQIAWALILLSLHFFVDEGSISLPQILITVSLGWLGLIKFTGMMLGAVVMLTVGADEILRRRRFPWGVLIFATSVPFFWLLAGQEFRLVLPYLAGSWEMSAGYTQAMRWGDNNEVMAVILFLLVAVTVSAPLAWTGLSRYRSFGILPLAGLAAIVFIVFKHGFVLCDLFHKVVAALSLMLIALMSLAISWPLLRRHGPRGVLIELLLLDVAVVYTTISFNSCVPGKDLLVALAESFPSPRLLSPGAFLSGPDELHTAYQGYLADIRNKFPLPQLSGDVDVYSWQQDVVFAYGLDYHPRPVIQSYSVYTPKLADLNAAYVHDGQSAENILFRVQTLNGKYPSIEDGRSWPELLTRYDISQLTKGFVLLKRSVAPRAYHLIPVKEVPIRFGERINLPATEGPIWAEIKIDKTLLGTLACWFYKPPELDLTVFLRGDQRVTYNLIPGMTSDGFLLSPLIKDNAGFMTFALGGEKGDLKDREVASLKIFADTASGSTACYKSAMRLCLYRLDFSPQKPAELEHERDSVARERDQPTHMPQNKFD